MKIAFFVDSFPSISQTFIIDQICALLDSGHEVDIYAKFDSGDRKVHSKVKEYQLHEKVKYLMPRNKLVRLIRGVFLILINFFLKPVKVIKSLNFLKYGDVALSGRLFYSVISLSGLKYDIIQCHFGPSGVTAVFLRELGLIEGKIITAFHGYDISRFLIKNPVKVYKELFERGDFFVPACKYFAQRLEEFGVNSQKIQVHPMGVDTDNFKYIERQTGVDSKTKIITIGRLVEKKGYEYVIKAVAELKKSRTDFVYRIVGDGPLRKSLESLADELDVSDLIEFFGSVDSTKVLELLYDSDIFVLTSVTAENGDQEAMPVVIKEAAATGLPVIVSEHSGLPEAAIEGKTGFIVPEKNNGLLAERINYLMDNPQECIRMGREGRELVVQKYKSSRLNQQLINLYKQILQNAKN